MDPGAVAVFIPIFGVLGLVGLVGLKTWSHHKLKMQEMSGGDDERLADAVQQLYEEVSSMRDDLGELHERVDFTERMLSEVRSKNAIGPGDPT